AGGLNHLKVSKYHNIYPQPFDGCPPTTKVVVFLLEKEGPMNKAKLTALRKQHRWSQTELAKRAGLSQQAIGHLEAGARDNPTADTLKRLAKALGVTVTDLL